MRYFLAIIITMFIAIQGSAQTYTYDGAQQTPIQWVRYLSDVEKAEIAYRVIQDDIKRREAEGMTGAEAVEFSFPASFFPESSIATDAQRASSGIPAGNVYCSINPQYPHAGSGPNSTTVIKAKTSASCRYDHVNPSVPVPPTIEFDLMMFLSGPGGLFWASHVRNSLNPIWSPSSAQVFADNCTNGNWWHSNAIWVTPPSGWTYTGPQPIPAPSTITEQIGNCP